MLNNASGDEALASELLLLERLLEDATLNAFAKSEFPVERSKSFFEFAAMIPLSSSLQTMEPNWQLGGVTTPQKAVDPGLEIRQLLHQALRCCRSPAVPIVAVLGLLNAGKSSLVSTYLSEPNRRRILVGSGNEQGTHRFVLWLPESWRNNPVLWDSIQERLLSIFGCVSESLSQDPELAMAQYNDTKPRRLADLAVGSDRLFQTIEIPLVATDSQLDRWGVALMDCPDVQTGFLPNHSFAAMGGNAKPFHQQTQSFAEARLSVLASASPLCSAFVVVLPANAMHDQTVSRLLRLLSEKMPRVKQFLAVNRVPRRYAAKEISQELNALYGAQPISRRYMAYSYDGPQQRERLPKPPDGFLESEAGDLPLFFRIDEHPISQPPAEIPKESWLLSIGSQLDKRGLFEDVLVSTTSKLRTQIKEAIHRSQAYVHEQLARAKLLQDLVANACLDFSTDGESGASKIRLQVSRQIINQVSKSLEKTAPWWAMPGRWTTRLAEASKSSIASATQWLQLPQWFSGKTEAVGRWIRTNWNSGKSGKIVTADVLLKHLQEQDRQGILQLDSAESDGVQLVRSACQRAIDRFQKESLTQLDDKQLDEFTAKMWSEMPMGKRLLTGFAPAGILFAPLLAVVMVPLDFGGSAVLVFASMKELLLAGAAGVGLAIVSADSMPQIAESEAAWQQMGDLFGVLCDELGLVRPLESDMPLIGVGNTARRMPVSRIAVNVDSVKQKVGNDKGVSPVIPANYELSPSVVAGIESALNRMVKA